MSYSLSFISQSDFENHVAKTIQVYNKTLNKIDLKQFNNNIIDPIKLLFDKSVYGKSFNDVIEFEIQRQRDKSNTNAIGYFHQNIFKYFRNCEVPEQGWDVITRADDKEIFVEMKNKHNTMNSTSSQKTYLTMLDKIIKNENYLCFLVEVIAKQSQNIPWGCSINGKHIENERIRRVSIDNFYKIVTKIDDAFYKMCMQLPESIDNVIKNNPNMVAQKDTVISELNKKSPDVLKSLYLLAFQSYEGFK